MSKRNPFTLTFGKVPDNYIDRTSCVDMTAEELTSENPSSQVFIFTGIRGCGKTVAMTAIEQKIRKEHGDEWIVIDLSIESNMLLEFASELDADKKLHALFTKANIEFSLGGLKVKMENASPAPSITVTIEKMLDLVTKAGKKVLVCVDEATNTETMREFASVFSNLIRRPYPVFLMMTGLPQNISNLQNVRTLTFLLRASKRVIEPLNFTLVRTRYEELIGCTRDEASQLAVITKGYSLCFQLLGYLVWEEKKNTGVNSVSVLLPQVLDKLDAMLEQFAYDKIWTDVPNVGKKILTALAEIAGNEQAEVSAVRKKAGVESALYNRYKQLLDEKNGGKGLIDTSTWGVMRFALPRFAEFVISRTFSER